MKTPIALALVALAFLTATNASAYHLSPPNVLVQLHGKLTFTPNEGGQPFKCGVTFYLKTKSPTKLSQIKTVKFHKGDCGVHFVSLPFRVGISGPNSGSIADTSFSSSSGNCSIEETSFQDSKSGIWTLPAGQCMSGTMTSDPPVTIVK